MATACLTSTEPARAARSAVPREKPLRRIALFTGCYTHIVDGVSRTLNRLVAHLEGVGYRVLVFGPGSDVPLIQPAGTFVPVPAVPIPGRVEYRMTVGLTAAQRAQLAAFDPDVYHVATPDPLGYQALQLARARGRPVVATYHTHFPSYLPYYRLGALEGMALRYLRHFYWNCQHVYVPTPAMLDVLHAMGFRPDTLRIWGRGVDTGHFTPARRSLAWRQRHGVMPGELLVTFVGRLVAEKGLVLFAAVVNNLRARGYSFRSMVVGEGPLGPQLRETLPDTIFTGHLSGDELAQAYASSDVFLYPSASEAFGNVIVEAMAAGLPVVCAADAGSSSHVAHHTTGLLAPPGDQAAFERLVARLLTDDALRTRLGQAARRRAFDYDWDRVLVQMEAYYNEVIATCR